MKQSEQAAAIATTLTLAGLLASAATTAMAQVQLQPSHQPPDSVVAVVADAQSLPFVPPDQRPVFGTFWAVHSSLPCLGAPLPCPPLDPATPVYAIGDPAVGGQFLVDETASQVISPQAQYGRRALRPMSAASVLQAQADELQNFVAQVQARQAYAQLRANGQMNPLSLDGPPPPGEGGGGGTNEWEGGITSGAYQYTTNDLWLEIVSMTVTNATANLVIHPPSNVTNGVYDLFSTTNLVPAWWNWVLRCAPGQTNLTVTNVSLPMEFFILGLTNDSDHGGVSDAYEGLLGLKTNDPADDHVTPIVAISVGDSVAIEQEPTNTASFTVTRLGGHMKWPLTVGLQSSGTAVLSANYSLSPVAITASNILITIPSNQTSVTLTLTPIDDHVADGTKTATLTLQTGDGWQVDTAQSSATAWILEEYSYTYTTVADFKQGVLDGLEAVDALLSDNGHLQFKTNLPPQFPFINVACSDRGTVVRINTTDGTVVGEYQTAPLGLAFTGADSPSGPSPSRTTVDLYGNVWVANRDDTRTINGTNYGSITRIGLITGGSRFDKNGTNYVSNPQGQYVALSNATYNTCIDRDGDGFIRTSSGLADILPWNNAAGADSDGGVSTAEDEAITEYTRVPCTGTRTIAVDKFNDIWVGGHTDNRTHLKVNGLLALPVPNSAFDANAGGYGGVIDGLGNLWSSDIGIDVWLKPPTNLPPVQGTDWQDIYASGTSPYGIAVDPLYPYIWQTSGDSVFRWHTNGTPETNISGNVVLYPHGGSESQGLAVDTNGHVWVAHKKDVSTTVGHVNTNGNLVGAVDLQVHGLWAEYFANTNLSGWPLLTNSADGPVEFSWTNGWPADPVPTNHFSARWSGIVAPLAQGEHVFYVGADAGAAFRLTVNGVMIIDNWTNLAPGAVELAGTNWLGTNVAYDITLEYAHFTDGAQVKLSWQEPGTTKQVIPLERFQSLTSDGINGATGISVDSAGKIWAGCYNSDTAVRINPNAGRLVVTADGQTNHVGLVDMVVSLGDGTWHQSPYDIAAHPYNYSDMTGFNERVVNPTFKPFKGYWIVANDSRNGGQLWNKVSWNATLTNGCSIEVYVRASDDRNGLGSEVFVPVTNNVFFSSIRGRFIEVRLGMVRDDTSKQPLLYDLTLQGASSGFAGDFFLDDARTNETENATFVVNLAGAQPMGYQWFILYPWQTNWAQLPGATHSTFTVTNVDSWVDWAMVTALVTNANGESLWLGPAFLEVWPLDMALPVSGSSGPASRYPAVINVFGQPTNLASATITLSGLSHTRSADLNLLLVSPSNKKIMLMSNAGGTNGVAGATLEFRQNWPAPPTSTAIPSWQTSHYEPRNYGGKTQLPGAPAGPYSIRLDDLAGDDPNGQWRLYIYDDVQPGGVGQLTGSWRLDFSFQ